MDIVEAVRKIADQAVSDGDFSTATFDQLAEEVMELHLALRGRHRDTPAMEWLEIASIAINALRLLPPIEVEHAIEVWIDRHGRLAAREPIACCELRGSRWRGQ